LSTCKTTSEPHTACDEVARSLGEIQWTETGELLAPLATGEGEDPDGGWIVIDETGEEVEQETAKITIAPAPTKPSPTQVEEHRITHCPIAAGVMSAQRVAG